MLGPVHSSFGTHTGVNIAREYPSKHEPHSLPLRLPPQELNAVQESWEHPNPGGSNANTDTKLAATPFDTGENKLRSTEALLTAACLAQPQYPVA